LGKTFHSAQKDMAERVRRVERGVRQIQQREDRKAQELTIPVDLWLQSGLEEGGILVIQPDPEIRRRLARILRRRGHKFQAVEGGQQALSAFRKASFSLMIVHWGIFQKSSDLVKLLRKSFPRTRIIITSSNFAWPNENSAGAQLGMEALEAGAYAYMPEQRIRRNIITCVETTLSSNARACPVLMSGLACNQRCVV
jgi:ActR/RegA family two-component response regulator